MRRLYVGASLLAKALDQSMLQWLTVCLREQARSHIEVVVDWKSVVDVHQLLDAFPRLGAHAFDIQTRNHAVVDYDPAAH